MPSLSTPQRRPPAQLPLFPLEIKHHILRFCDPSTLATTSRVSLAFLQLSSPILYQDIELVGLRKVEEIFCSRESALDQPHLHPYLDIQRHVRSFIITALPEQGRYPNPSFVQRSLLSPRLPSSGTLSVESLHVRPIGTHNERDEDSQAVQWALIFALFDPKTVRIEGILDPSSRIPLIDLRTSPWTSLTHLSLTKVISDRLIGDVNFASSPTPPLSVVFELPPFEEMVDDAEKLFGLYREVVRQLGPDAFERWEGGRLKDFLVQVELQRDMDLTLRFLQDTWEVKERFDFADFRPRIRFEVAPSVSDDEEIKS